MTVNFPNGRSRSIPLRLFWRAPRISTQPLSGGAVTQGFLAVVEPTEDYPIARTGSQIFGATCLGFEPFRDLIALGAEPVRHIGLERVEKFRLGFELRLPLFRLYREQFAELRIVDVIGADQSQLLAARNPSNRRLVRMRA